MKKNRFLAFLGLIAITGTLAGCGSNNGDFIIEDTSSQAEAVINYNDNLVDTASTCIASENIIRNTYDNENSSIDDIKNAINNTIKECTTAKKNINSLGDWEGDSSLKEGIINIIEKYITYYTKFSEILPYLEQEEITEEQNEKYESILAEIETLDNELNEANNTLIVIQEQFAKNHGFELESEEDNEEIETYNEDDTETYDEEETETYDEEENETYEEEAETDNEDNNEEENEIEE